MNFDHPHLGIPGRGFSVDWVDGEIVTRTDDFRDLYGHGTCCAALIHLLAPDAQLIAARVTGDRATTDADRLAEGIERAAEAGASIICVPMATRTALRHGLDAAVAAAFEAGAALVAADPGLSGGAGTGRRGALGSTSRDAAPRTGPVSGPGGPQTGPVALPAGCAEVLAVGMADDVDVARTGHETVIAEGRPRPVGGLSGNFRGPSLSAARAAAALSRFAESSGLCSIALVRGFKKSLDVR